MNTIKTGTIPTVVVIVLLASVGLWGHFTGWKMPKFSTLIGAHVGDDVEWCAEHNVPESMCIACRAELMPKGTLHGWCKQHGVHECALCHPDVAQLNKPPGDIEQDAQQAKRALAVRARVENNAKCTLHLRRIQFVSREAAEGKTGIDIRLAERKPIVEGLKLNGEVVYDPERIARLSSPVDGRVWRVEKRVGDTVREGEVLALVDAAAVGNAKADLLQAAGQLQLKTKTLERLTNLGDIVPGKRRDEAQTARDGAEIAMRGAMQRLVNLGLKITFAEVGQMSNGELARFVQFLGLPGDLAEQLDPEQTTSNLVPIVAPHAGSVATRDIVQGEVVDAKRTLFTVVDTGRMWLMLNVPLEEVRYVSRGQKVVFRPDGDSRQHAGSVTWISSDVDKDTRTVAVRAELPNPEGRLRNETFGAGEIILREEPAAIVVPSDAVHWEGCCHVVFVRDKDYMQPDSFKVFHARSVRPGVTLHGETEILAGLLPREVVVTKGSGALRAELLKGNLGAG